MARLHHGTSSLSVPAIMRDGFAAGTFFSPCSKTAGLYAVRAVRRDGGDPVVIVCEVADELVKPSPDFDDPVEVIVPGALPVSVILSAGPEPWFEHLGQMRRDAAAAVAGLGEALRMPEEYRVKAARHAAHMRERNEYLRENLHAPMGEQYRELCRIRDEHRRAWDISDAA